MSTKFATSELDDILAIGNEVALYEFVESRRWYDLFEFVFWDHEAGCYFRAWHMAPSTELQEGQDEWDTDANGMVELEVVEPYEVTVTQYWPVTR